jgi:hypothetical protein
MAKRFSPWARTEIPVYSASTQKELTDARGFSKPHLGAFFAPQKTGLFGGFAACAAAPRPFNPLRGSQYPKGWT